MFNPNNIQGKTTFTSSLQQQPQPQQQVQQQQQQQTNSSSLASYDYADDNDTMSTINNNNNNSNNNNTPPTNNMNNNSNNNNVAQHILQQQFQSLFINSNNTMNQSFDLSSSTGSLSDSIGSNGGLATSTGSNGGLSTSGGNVATFTSSPRTSRESNMPLSSSSSGNNNSIEESNYNSAKIYLNNRPNNINQHGLGRVDFNMKSEDLDQCWFHKEATRDVSIALLNSKPSGTFLIRPSSQPGSYAMSWVKNHGDIGHNLIYGLCPGYSLKQNPTSPTDRFWSLQALVEGCDYLSVPVTVSSSTASITKSSNAKTNSEVLGRIIEKLIQNDSNLNELIWNLRIIENPNENVNRAEKRTIVKYCDEEYMAPEILPLNGNALTLIAQSLHNNSGCHSLYINGYEGYLRMSFQPNIGDTEAAHIANMLCKNKSITLLNLSINEITDTGAKALAYALKSNTSLKYLSLSNNFISKEGLVALSDAIEENRTLDFIDVSNQLYKSRNIINLVHTNIERTLIGLLEDTLKRKCELVGLSNPIDIERPLNSNSIHSISLQKLPYFHGFLTKERAEKRLRTVGKPGSFLFYLNHYVPNSIFLTYISQAAEHSGEIVHRMIHRVHFGYRFVSGGLNERDLNRDVEVRDEALEEEILYNFHQSNPRALKSHSNSYDYSYRYRPKRKGCGVVVPTLFEYCSWVLASSAEYEEISKELSEISLDIEERFKAIHDLVPLWGARNVRPVVATLQNTKQTISRKGVYSTLAQLYKLNKSKLSNPVTVEQYRRLAKDSDEND